MTRRNLKIEQWQNLVDLHEEAGKYTPLQAMFLSAFDVARVGCLANYTKQLNDLADWVLTGQFDPAEVMIQFLGLYQKEIESMVAPAT